MTDFLSPLAKSLTPYVPGEQPKDKVYIKLNTNENPYGPSARVKQAISQEIENLRLYPDPDCDLLRQCVAGYYDVEKENVFVGNGSDEVLAMAFPAFFTGSSVMFPSITYSFYPVYAELFGTDYVEVPLGPDFSIDPLAYCRPDYPNSAKRMAGILLPNPNAPTGRGLLLAEIEGIVAANPDKVVLIDEAYIDFGGESAVGLIEKYDNLLVVMTLSKSRSLAGLRLGFAIGAKGLIDGLNTIKNSFNSYTVDRLAMLGAVAAIGDDHYFRQTRDMIIHTRDRISTALQDLGFIVIPSMANFVFVSHPLVKAVNLFNDLRERGILVRYFSKPLIEDYLRVTIGTDEEMDAFLKAVRALVG